MDITKTMTDEEKDAICETQAGCETCPIYPCEEPKKTESEIMNR